MRSIYIFTFLNSIPFTWANSWLVAPNTDLIYFFTSVAMSTNPVSVVYNVLFLAILELLIVVYAVDTALFLAVRSVCLAVNVAIFRGVSFGK